MEDMSIINRKVGSDYEAKTVDLSTPIGSRRQ
jgi:hypothetical protein